MVDRKESDVSTELAVSASLLAPLSGLHARVVDELGLDVSRGTLSAGSIMRIEELEARYSVSRSVIREAIRVLASMGMVMSRRRVGVQVLAPSEWNLFDPQVIRWRLASPHRVNQLRSLTELRAAIEPEAARLAAERASSSEASEIFSLAGKLWAAGQAEEVEHFLELDITFHSLILASSGNLMFGKLSTLVAEVLSGRTHYGLMPRHPHDDALQMHVDVASAIQRGHGVDAHTAMLGIMNRTLSEMTVIWESEQSG